MPRPTLFEHAQSLVAPIRAVSVGGLAHEALCGDRLRARATRALDVVRREPLDGVERYRRVMHASGLVGAAAARLMTRPLSLPLDLLVGTGRHRYSGSEAPRDAAHVHYVEALVNHPLDTGLLGLVSAYNLAKHAMIAGCLGAVVGAGVGLMLWPLRGMQAQQPVAEFVALWVQRGAFYAGSFGALMGSCLIMAPHNYIAVQGLRVLTAIPKLLAQVVGYGVGIALAATYLLAGDAASAAREGARRLMAGAASHNPHRPSLDAAGVGTARPLATSCAQGALG